MTSKGMTIPNLWQKHQKHVCRPVADRQAYRDARPLHFPAARFASKCLPPMDCAARHRGGGGAFGTTPNGSTWLHRGCARYFQPGTPCVSRVSLRSPGTFSTMTSSPTNLLTQFDRGRHHVLRQAQDDRGVTGRRDIHVLFRKPKQKDRPIRLEGWERCMKVLNAKEAPCL